MESFIPSDVRRSTVARGLQGASGVTVAVSVVLAAPGTQPSADSIASKAAIVASVSQNTALTASVFKPITDSVASATGQQAAAFVPSVAASSIAVTGIPPPPAQVPHLSPGAIAVIVIFSLILLALGYVFVAKPTWRRNRVTVSRLSRAFGPKFGPRAVPVLARVAHLAPSLLVDDTVATPEGRSAWALASAPALRAAAEAGSAGAQAQLGLRFLKGEGGVAKDSSLAADWLRRAAEQGDPRSEALLGALFLRGGKEAEFDLGMDFVHSAASHGVDAVARVIDAARGSGGRRETRADAFNLNGDGTDADGPGLHVPF